MGKPRKQSNGREQLDIARTHDPEQVKNITDNKGQDAGANAGQSPAPSASTN